MATGDFGHCCTDCQIYWSCDTKWYRGEKGEEDICCARCNYYRECEALFKKKTKTRRKKQK